MLKSRSAPYDIIYKSTGYKFEHFIAEGSFCEGVYTLSNGESSEKLAIKITSPKDLGRLKNEHRILKNLHHPNIVQTKMDLFKGSNYTGMVMEYVDGCDLLKVLYNSFDDDDTYIAAEPAGRHVFSSIVSGLGYLHSQSIIHYDLKPENILIGCDSMVSVDKTTTVKICDFGLSSKATSKQKNTGSFPFVDPELFLKVPLADIKKADIWSLGCLFYTLCVGRMLVNMDKLNIYRDKNRERCVNCNTFEGIANRIVYSCYHCKTKQCLFCIRKIKSRTKHIKKNHLKLLTYDVLVLSYYSHRARHAVEKNKYLLRNPDAVDVLSTMLRVDSNDRASILEISQHPYCTEF